MAIDISIDNEPIGTITIGLFGEDAPKTVKNFQTICTKGINGKTYAETKFHRIIDKFIIQGKMTRLLVNLLLKWLTFEGGDIVSNDGRGAISIYGKYFEDENLAINHTGPGFIGMANRGRDTNGCQFYITTMSSPWLNGVHTIFGKVVYGAAYVHVIEKVCWMSQDTKTTKSGYSHQHVSLFFAFRLKRTIKMHRLRKLS